MWLTSGDGLIPHGCLQEDSSDVEFDDLDIYVDQIYAKYGMNANYDRIHPVYLHPTNPDQYILLTSGNVDTWAKALVSVLSHSPDLGIQFTV